MTILAVDTCLGAVSAALCWRDSAGGERIAERYEPCRAGHAERLLPMVEAVLAEAGKLSSDIRRVAVTLGPGTFTGVRTGVAFARAYALSACVEVVGATSLHVMAAGLPTCADATAIVVDARKGQAFVQLFGADGLSLGDPQLLTFSEAADCLSSGPWRVAGSAATAVAAAGRERGIVVASVIAECEPHASDLVRMASALTPITSITPIYLRAPDALPQAGKGLARATE